MLNILLKIVAVSCQGFNLARIVQVEKVAIQRMSGENIGLHEKGQGKLVLFS